MTDAETRLNELFPKGFTSTESMALSESAWENIKALDETLLQDLIAEVEYLGFDATRVNRALLLKVIKNKAKFTSGSVPASMQSNNIMTIATGLDEKGITALIIQVCVILLLKRTPNLAQIKRNSDMKNFLNFLITNLGFKNNRAAISNIDDLSISRVVAANTITMIRLINKHSTWLEVPVKISGLPSEMHVNNAMSTLPGTWKNYGYGMQLYTLKTSWALAGKKDLQGKKDQVERSPNILRSMLKDTTLGDDKGKIAFWGTVGFKGDASDEQGNKWKAEAEAWLTKIFGTEKPELVFDITTEV